MARKDRNKLIKTYSVTRRQEIKRNFSTSEPVLGTISAAVTGGSAAFGTQDTNRPGNQTDYYDDMTVTVSQTGGTSAVAVIEVSGTDQGSFQIVEINGLSVGPFDLNDASISDLLSLGFEGASTTFKINVKSPQPSGAKSAELKIKNDSNEVVASFNLTATAVDPFLTAALELPGNVTIYSCTDVSTGLKSGGDKTMSVYNEAKGATYLNENVSATVQVVNATSGSAPTIYDDINRPFISWTLSKGIEGDAFADIVPAGPVFDSDATGTLAGTFILIFQGTLIETDSYNGQATIFNFTSNTTGAWGDSSLRLQFNGISSNQIKLRLVGTASTAEFTVDPARTILVVFSRDSLGAIDFYVQEAGINSAVTPNSTTNATKNFTEDSEFVFYPTSSALNGSIIRLIGIIATDSDLRGTDVQSISAAIK